MGKTRGLSAERIAKYILLNEGFTILDERKVFKLNNVEIAEVDYIVQNESGEKFIVEVKAGDIDVSTIRNVYANAETLNMKPMIVGRGYSNTAAEVLANKLGITILFFKDYFLMLDPLDLEVVLRGVLLDVFDEYGIKPITFVNLEENEKNVLFLLSDGLSIEEISLKLNSKPKEIFAILKSLRKKGILPRHEKNYVQLVKYAKSTMFWITLNDRLSSLELQLHELSNQIKSLAEELKNKRE